MSAGEHTGQQTEFGTIGYNYDAIDQLVAATNSALGNEQYVYDLMVKGFRGFGDGK